MKVLHVGTSTNPVTSTTGGALQRRQVEMASLQVADGHDVVVVSPGTADGTETISGIRVETIGLRTRRPVRDFEFLRGIRARLSGEGIFDVLHAHGAPHAGRALRHVARRSVHSVDFFAYRGSNTRLGRRAYSAQLRQFDMNLPVSEFCHSEFRAYYPDVTNTDVLANGVNLDEFRPDARAAEAAREALALPEAALVVYLGRVCEQKGSDMLAGLARELRISHPAARVVAAGPGDSFGNQGRTPLMEQLADAGVIVLGAVEEQHLPGLLSLATISLLPTRRDEMFGMAALEALACGTPVVASRLGGIPEAVGPGGSLFPPGDEGALLAEVSGLLDSPEAQTRMAKDGLAHANQFGWRSIVDRAYQVYAPS